MLPCVFVCKFKLPSKVDRRLPLITYTSQFRIPKFVVQISDFGIRNSEFGIVKENGNEK